MSADVERSGAPTDVPAAEQLSHALVTEADLVQSAGRTNFHLRLEPPQLGRVQIHLTAAEHTISARVIVSHEGARQLLEGQAQHLRQSLAEAGLVLGRFDVTHQGGNFSDSERRESQELPQAPVPRLASSTSRAVATTTPIVPAGGIDILA